MKKVINCLAPLLLAASTTAHADFIGGTIEASYWYAAPSGDAFAPGTSVDLEENFNFEDKGVLEIAASVEHPVPLIPNVKLRYTEIDQTEDGSIANAFDGVNTGSVETNLNLTNLDAIIYYEILDNWVSIDLGLDIKVFDGQLEVKGANKTSLSDIDSIFPLPYAKAEFELPFTGMAFGAEVSGLSFEGSGIYDARARIRQNISLAFIELGYRSMGIKIDDIGFGDTIEVDANFSGAYLSTGLDF